MRRRLTKIRDRIINYILLNPEIYKETFKREELTMQEVDEFCEIFDITIPSFYRILDTKKCKFIEKKDGDKS